MFSRRASMLSAIVLCVLAACAVDPDDGPTAEELDEVDAWAVASDGKADLPTQWNDLVAKVKDFYYNQMTVVWHHQEHPATASAAIARVRTLAQQAGIADPTKALYRTTVQKMATDHYFDHSEVDVRIGANKFVRLIGDSAGSGVFVDTALFEDTIGPKLCLTWSELQDAINASYRSGHYGLDFVCHTVTEYVLRSLDVNPRAYSGGIRTFSIASWIWGPLLPSLDSTNPARWAVSRTGCSN